MMSLPQMSSDYLHYARHFSHAKSFILTTGNLGAYRRPQIPQIFPLDMRAICCLKKKQMHAFSKKNYGICRFSHWRFPHDSYKDVWKPTPLNAGVAMVLREDDTASEFIKYRDGVCPVTGSNYSLTMHIMPQERNDWVRILIVI
jgi:hypothetical protein